jgi:hypothetical protein
MRALFFWLARYPWGFLVAWCLILCFAPLVIVWFAGLGLVLGLRHGWGVIVRDLTEAASL